MLPLNGEWSPQINQHFPHLDIILSKIRYEGIGKHQIQLVTMSHS